MTDAKTAKGVLNALCATDETLPAWLRDVQPGELVVESNMRVTDVHELAQHFDNMTQGWVSCQSHTKRYTSGFSLAGHADTLLQAEACDGGSVSVHASLDGDGWRVVRIRRVSSEAALISSTAWLARSAGRSQADDEQAAAADGFRYAAYEVCWQLVHEPGLPVRIWREHLGRFAGWRENNHA
jgi:hypothetical protein